MKELHRKKSLFFLALRTNKNKWTMDNLHCHSHHHGTTTRFLKINYISNEQQHLVPPFTASIPLCVLHSIERNERRLQKPRRDYQHSHHGY